MMADKFVHTLIAQKDGVEHPVVYQVTVGGGERCGVLVEFPDGRSLDMSVHEWIAIGVHAVEAAAHTQDIAETMRRKSIAWGLAPLRQAVTELLAEIDRRAEKERA